jgi:inhibitor of cysteine peptidase
MEWEDSMNGILPESSHTHNLRRASKMLVYSENNQFIKATHGQYFAISLPSNPSTGYSWEPEYSKETMRLHETKSVLDDSSEIGGGGREVFTFQATRVGHSRIEMNYQRPWEGVPEKTVSFDVHIYSQGVSD